MDQFIQLYFQVVLPVGILSAAFLERSSTQEASELSPLETVLNVLFELFCRLVRWDDDMEANAANSRVASERANDVNQISTLYIYSRPLMPRPTRLIVRTLKTYQNAPRYRV